MKSMQRSHKCSIGWLIALAIGVLPRDAAAYIDPGTTGRMSQVLYMLFYGVLGVFFYFLRYIKLWVGKAKTFLAEWFGRHT
jgi:hypothetical protein